MLSIPNYVIETRLGVGGVGVVYKGLHTLLERPVAIKVLHDMFAMDANIRERFINEAKTMAKLMHPNIVQLFDFMIQGEQLILVMEFVEGKTLDHLIGREVGPIPYQKALPMFKQMLEGVTYAHERGIIHRDIKPSNIMISNDGIVKITDFGIAKIVGLKGTTKTGTKMGTLYYMSPEQVQGKEANFLFDIYSLGITLYEMLAGRLPFVVQDTSEFQIMTQIVNEPLPDPRTFYPDIPQELVEVVATATAKNPAERFQSCKEFLNVINSILQDDNTQIIKITNPPKEKIKSVGLQQSEKKEKKSIFGWIKKELIILQILLIVVPALYFYIYKIDDYIEKDKINVTLITIVLTAFISNYLFYKRKSSFRVFMFICILVYSTLGAPLFIRNLTSLYLFSIIVFSVVFLFYSSKRIKETFNR